MQVVALSTWPHGRDVVTCERCVVIFLKTVKGVMFDINIHQIFSQILRLYEYIYIGIYMLNLLKVLECKHTK